MKTALILGAGGFIGSHMAKRLKEEGYWVRGVDLKYPEFSNSAADDFVKADLRDPKIVENVLRLEANPDNNNVIYNYSFSKKPYTDIILFDEIYQFAADMGGAGFVFTEEHDADILHNSATINLNVLNVLRNQKLNFGDNFKTKIFYSSSACIYPKYNQEDPDNPQCSENSAYPAAPDSDYGWEKLFSERLYAAYHKNYDIPIAVARYHNIYGPEGTWDGGREKAPAAFCRKLAKVKNNDIIECWGDGVQTRSFLYIDDCIEATRRLTKSDYKLPINIGSEEMVSINKLINIVEKCANKSIKVKHIPGPEGVRGRNSDNTLIKEILNWDYEWSLEQGIQVTYNWIETQVKNEKICN
jgi:nucleoside-diphosphate-sugar epimerase